LAFPAVVGVATWISDLKYSALLGLLTSIWAVTFIEVWARKEETLASEWQISNVSTTRRRNPAYQPKMSRVESWLRRFVSIASTGGMTLILQVLLVGVFLLQVAVDEFYAGPLKSIASLVPTVIYTLSVTVLITFYASFSRRLTAFENHETEEDFTEHLAQKMFLFNSLLVLLFRLNIHDRTFHHRCCMRSCTFHSRDQSIGMHRRCWASTPKSTSRRRLFKVRHFVLVLY
jgi:hypothetical protein